VPLQRRRDIRCRAAAAAAGGPGAPPGRMRVAVSGASGFVGSRLVSKLLAGGHEVRVLARDVDKARKALRPESLPSGRPLILRVHCCS